MCMLNAWVLLWQCNEYQSFLMQETTQQILKPLWTMNIKRAVWQVLGFKEKVRVKVGFWIHLVWRIAETTTKWKNALWDVQKKSNGMAGHFSLIKSAIFMRWMATLYCQLSPWIICHKWWFLQTWNECDFKVIGIGTQKATSILIKCIKYVISKSSGGQRGVVIKCLNTINCDGT